LKFVRKKNKNKVKDYHTWLKANALTAKLETSRAKALTAQSLYTTPIHAPRRYKK